MTDFRHRLALHNAQVELEALRAEGRAMVWANEKLMHRRQEPQFIEEHFNELAKRIRSCRVGIDGAHMHEGIRS